MSQPEGPPVASEGSKRQYLDVKKHAKITECKVILAVRKLPGGISERHVVFRDVVGSCKVPDDTGRGTDTHVADEGEKPAVDKRNGKLL